MSRKAANAMFNWKDVNRFLRERGVTRILWHLIKHREASKPEVFRQAEAKLQHKKLARLHNNTAALGFKLIPAQ